jgi:uracil-DNA glycosylase
VSARRDRILAEIGVRPLWRLRHRETPDAAPAADPSPAAIPPAPPANDGPELELDDRAARIARMEWPALKSAVATCEACGLCRTRTNTVFGVGDERAEWVIVGEAPGAEEDARGEPFVGQAGRLLDSMLAAVALRRGENVYIANVLKCRPPGNRNPEPYEVAQCSPHLVRQIELIRPKVILAMGRAAAQLLLNTDASIASLRGRLFRYQGVTTIVTYHPAYLLRNLPDKSKAWEDLCFALATMKDLKAATGPQS